MCGLCGILFEKRRRALRAQSHLLDVFTRLLVLSESRGHHASGVAWVKSDGSCDVYKAPMPASDFVGDKGYARVLAGVDNKTAILMGHTRWRTQGSENNNGNNHPLAVDAPGQRRRGLHVPPQILLTHNGHLSNANALFRRFHFPRQAEVDSEILAHFAARAIAEESWDLDELRSHFALCQGTMSAVIASTDVPETVLIVKGNKPLFLLYSHRRRVIVYASDRSILWTALEDETGWDELRVSPMTLATFDHKHLIDHREEPFTLGFPADGGSRTC